MFVVWRGGEEMLAVAGEGGELVWAAVDEVVRMAWFVEMRLWLVVGGCSKITTAKEKWQPQRSQPGSHE